MCNDSLATRCYLNPDVFEPQLAEKWEISDDKLTYTIHLRKGVLWHDFTDPTTRKRYENVEVTADDFKFYVDVIKNPKIPCEPIRAYFEDLQELRVLDRYTFQVIWKRRYWQSEATHARPHARCRGTSTSSIRPSRTTSPTTPSATG